MNNTFNIRRFGLLLKKDFQENWKRYSLQCLTMFGIMLTVFLIIAMPEYDNNYSNYVNEVNTNLLVASIFLFFILGLLFASSMMEPMKNKTKRISYLLNPCSSFEKFFSRWLIITIGFIIMFFAVLWLSDLIRVAICSLRFPALNVKLLDLSKLVYTGPEEWYYGSEFLLGNCHLLMLGLSIYFFTQSLLVLGSTLWEKATFIKTFSAAIVISLLYILICRWTILIFYGNFNEFGYMMNTFQFNQVNETKVMALVTYAFFFFAVLNWAISYFRFKESEIIKRW